MRRLNEPSHLDLFCLQKPVNIACGSERVKQICIKKTLKQTYKVAGIKLWNFWGGAGTGEENSKVFYFYIKQRRKFCSILRETVCELGFVVKNSESH